MAIANLAMATGNMCRPGVGVNPLRGQNNVQGSCDMASFPHELTGYRHISDAATRADVRDASGTARSIRSPACASRTCSTRPSRARSRRIYIQGEDILQSDPNTHHVAAGLAAMECVVVQDLFLNETANYAHVFLPGCTFLEKDGTFTNAERRIQMVTKVMRPKNGYGDWEITQLIAQKLGMDWNYKHPSEIMDEIARLTPTFKGVSFEKIRELGSIQWPCNEEHPEGTPIMHVGEFVARQGQVHDDGVRADRRADRRALSADPDHGPHPLAVQRRRSDAAHRERRCGMPRTCSRSIRSMPSIVASRMATG